MAWQHKSEVTRNVHRTCNGTEAGRANEGDIKCDCSLEGLGTHVGSTVKFAASPTGRGIRHYIKMDVATTTAPNSA